jgi:hypothetical protein
MCFSLEEQSNLKLFLTPRKLFCIFGASQLCTVFEAQNLLLIILLYFVAEIQLPGNGILLLFRKHISRVLPYLETMIT